jgi:hypothetical protein
MDHVGVYDPYILTERNTKIHKLFKGSSDVKQPLFTTVEWFCNVMQPEVATYRWCVAITMCCADLAVPRILLAAIVLCQGTVPPVMFSNMQI